MKITFDNKEMVVDNKNDNIVQVAQKNGVTIIAPCFRNNRKHGGCGACLIEVDGKEAFACGTKPYEGMNIVYNTPILEEKRKERLKQYTNNIKNNATEKNKCSNFTDTACGTGGGCGCSGGNSNCCK